MAKHTSTASEPNESAPSDIAALASARSRRHAGAAAARRYAPSDTPSASDVPTLVSSASSTSSETSGSISFASERTFDDSAPERMPFHPTSPPPPFNGSAPSLDPRRATASRGYASTTPGGRGAGYAHTGGLYSSPPDAGDCAYGDDLLTDLARPTGVVPIIPASTLYPGVVPQATGGHSSRHRQPMKPAMARWLDDDSDRSKYWLSYGGRR
ncbi:hypothetical protein LTR91_017886 [Friedmanniomyces endolithicus]|uniref:Uncharacterized protein n=1 Tax=Friedmanniomyces endolithicus TaxID=329885 RepID=A0AAN6J1P7_9PEZI|nr:hypothetical protein LTS00_016135 [Friedmanniomyces endolithicus]KAK0273931.1 hypothetical protein LTR35_012059 [Friedmanniomyces endolithicus]KAK0305302.1 hypothetical protein LTR01_006826 [Friedmanniomyces endolithicus]KAK0307713.1 hypothetical protein LTR82_015853 [Friedmanniomyces endolithicus]KAK0823337.1 hypothetical protein LTR73_008579 [Friedmanniomyces endolithicus]